MIEGLMEERYKNLHRRMANYLAKNRRGGVNTLAAATGLSRQTVSRIANGTSKKPDAESLKALENALETLEPKAGVKEAPPVYQSGSLTPLALMVKDLRTLADILESPEIPNEIKGERFNAFIRGAGKGIDRYLQEAK